MKIKSFNRTDKNPVFMNSYIKNEIRVAARRWLFQIQSRGMDVGKDLEDIEGDLLIMWCEICHKHKDSPEELACTEFKRMSEWKLTNYIRDYFNYLDGNPERGPEPFEPDFYQFLEMYRNGSTHDELAEHYGVSTKTIQRYVQKNYVTREPINAKEYLIGHEKIYGKDPAYWSIRSELLSEFEVD